MPVNLQKRLIFVSSVGDAAPNNDAFKIVHCMLHRGWPPVQELSAEVDAISRAISMSVVLVHVSQRLWARDEADPNALQGWLDFVAWKTAWHVQVYRTRALARPIVALQYSKWHRATDAGPRPSRRRCFVSSRRPSRSAEAACGRRGNAAPCNALTRVRGT